MKQLFRTQYDHHVTWLPISTATQAWYYAYRGLPHREHSRPLPGQHLEVVQLLPNGLGKAIRYRMSRRWRRIYRRLLRRHHVAMVRARRRMRRERREGPKGWTASKPDEYWIQRLRERGVFVNLRGNALLEFCRRIPDLAMEIDLGLEPLLSGLANGGAHPDLRSILEAADFNEEKKE